jgi:hypothetical protein
MFIICKNRSTHDNDLQSMAGSKGIQSKPTAASAGSPIQKAARKPLQSLKYSPKTKINRANRVFVTGTRFGIILLCTEKATSTNDAFTNTVIQQLERGQDRVAERLNIQKICFRRMSQAEDTPMLQTNTYPSIWWVSIGTEATNTPEHRRQLAETFIQYLNETNWQYPQQFVFAGDETEDANLEIAGTLDMYLLNRDIGGLLGTYIFEDFEGFLQDEDAVKGAFGLEANLTRARALLADAWNSWGDI